MIELYSEANVIHAFKSGDKWEMVFIVSKWDETENPYYFDYEFATYDKNLKLVKGAKRFRKYMNECVKKERIRIIQNYYQKEIGYWVHLEEATYEFTGERYKRL